MSDNDCTLAVGFDPQDERTCNKMRELVVRSFRIEAERLDSLLANGSFIIRNMDASVAERWASRFEAKGASCRIGQQSFSQNASLEKNAAPGGKNEATRTCPKCGNVQPARTNECRYCGVIFRKMGRHATQITAELAPPDKHEGFQFWSANKIMEWVSGQFIGGFWRRNAPRVSRWNKRTGDALAGFVIVSAIAWAMEIGLLFLCKMIWGVYTSTAIGQHYVLHFALGAASLEAIMRINAPALALQIVFSTMFITLLIGGIGQLLHIVRYFFEPLGLIGKVIFWFGPVAALTAAYINSDSGFLFAHAFVLVVIPTFCIISSSMNVVQLIIPEIGDLLTFGTRMFRGGRTDWVQRLKPFFLKWFG